MALQMAIKLATIPVLVFVLGSWSAWVTHILRHAPFENFIQLVMTTISIVLPFLLGTIVVEICVQILMPYLSQSWVWALLVMVASGAGLFLLTCLVAPQNEVSARESIEELS